ncbi:hypothetical protein EON82_14100 [bacterium]|nr:MAG: hypothetical protein EON82_14100 [bacterium]
MLPLLLTHLQAHPKVGERLTERERAAVAVIRYENELEYVRRGGRKATTITAKARTLEDYEADASYGGKALEAQEWDKVMRFLEAGIPKLPPIRHRRHLEFVRIDPLPSDQYRVGVVGKFRPGASFKGKTYVIALSARGDRIVATGDGRGRIGRGP